MKRNSAGFTLLESVNTKMIVVVSYYAMKPWRWSSTIHVASLLDS
ncbi:MAG TPA: hypothetical protein VKF36_20905 [Syntrophorhabdales bacterium]|nr:hypothetical protein [Syntrophorhabdales bacterium]